MSSVLHPTAIADLIPFVLLCYDYTLTLSMEVDRYWMRPKLSWAAFLFFSNRYLALLGHVPSMMSSLMESSIPTPLCYPLQMYSEVLIVVIQLIGGVVMGCRVYAMYNRCRCVLVLMVSVAAIALTIGLWAILTDGSVGPQAPPPSGPTGCVSPMSDAQAVRLATAWGGQTFFDVLIFGLTLWQAWLMRVPGSMQICCVLLRDGVLYFCIITLTNIANIITLTLGDAYSRGACACLTNILCSMMISRLMLNLRDPKLAFTTASFTSDAAVSEQCSALAENLPVVATRSAQPLAREDDASSYVSLASTVRFVDPLWDTSDSDSCLSLPPKARMSPAGCTYLYA